MSTSDTRELVLTRIIDATPAELYKAWTARLPEWWGPHGMTTPVCEMELKAGGIFRTVMKAEDGTEYPGTGVFLEVVPDERIVFTDAYTPGWEPSKEPFFTCVTTFEDAGEGKTCYTARARHWKQEDKEKHKAMGFHDGWGQSLDRLVALVVSR